MLQLRRYAFLFLLGALFAGCTEIRETQPDRTANEQLLISTATDLAVKQLKVDFLNGSTVFLDTSFFKSYDQKYAIGTFRSQLARLGASLARAKDKADYIVEIRSGALSINQERFYIGFGGFDVPVPLSEAVEFPVAKIYENYDRTAIAKFETTILSAESGSLIADPGPIYGLAWIDQNSVLGIGWKGANILPQEVNEKIEEK